MEFQLGRLGSWILLGLALYGLISLFIDVYDLFPI